MLEYYGMVARFGHQECARPKLPFQPLKFSPSRSLCCAFQRDIRAPSVRLNLLAGLHILVSPRRGAFHLSPLLAGFQCCVHRSRNSCSRSSVPIPELTMIMIAQYNVRNYPPPLTHSRTYYNNKCRVQRTELPPPPPLPQPIYNEF